MAIDARQQRYLQRFFPGLVESVAALGPGEFRPEPPVLKQKGPGLRGVGLHLTYDINDENLVSIKISSRLKPGIPPYEPDDTVVDLDNWERSHYALHYGGRRYEDCTFRFDLDEFSGHHVHIQPDPKIHIPSSRVIPDVTNLDPRKFVDMVAAYRNKKKYPVRLKP